MVIFALVEIFNIAAIRTLLVGIPESAGLLVFGVGLVLTAVLIRRLLGRKADEEADETFGKEV
ncbi:MAG TPA: hypothetical protein VHQ01_08045 [Pyrinomonadaceae bacterium]|nr:hypothetical protein [Pyrinomonadaceae bacterium]